ncbi:hypothetical protein K435DRAFT_856592 [Dendrothele bispora CBS 962.96]|uniref:Uncharacterized protein n=1 Tax=Dendrothele bispora (strain CBS 962.96) TaxID=1314807 RepID=A0A4V4HGE0_DENBC|nr:hypothetical protein K435DRAFT_856592 [Dendrothele bispora CBS 962.96]
MSLAFPPPSSASDTAFLTQEWAIVVETNGTTIALSGILFGIQFAAYVASMHVIFRRGLKHSTARLALIFTSTTMVLSSGIVMGSIIAQSRTQVRSLTTHSTKDLSLGRLNFILVMACSGVMFLLNDILIIWRAWILVDRVPRGILGLCFAGTLASVLVFWVKAFSKGPIALPLVSLLIGVPLLVTNITATSMIGWKLWGYRKTVKAYIQSSASRNDSAVESILILLIESGFIHLLYWVFTQIAMHQSLDGSEVISHMMLFMNIFLIGLHPMLVTLFVTRQQSGLDAIHQEESMTRSLEFAPNPRDDLDSRMSEIASARLRGSVISGNRTHSTSRVSAIN